MHSLPSRRRLPQPNFFRFKCYRLSPLPVPLLPPPSLPAPAPPPLPGLLPAAHLPPVDPPPVVSSADTHALAHTVTPAAAAVRRQARRPPANARPRPQRRRHCHRRQTRRPPPPHAPGTVRQADARLDVDDDDNDCAVGRQGSRTFTQSANRDSVIAVVCSRLISCSTPEP